MKQIFGGLVGVGVFLVLAPCVLTHAQPVPAPVPVQAPVPVPVIPPEAQYLETEDANRALARAQAPQKLSAAPKGFDARRDNIERGKVETVEYDSKTVGAKRKMVIYTPPGYSKDAKYSVFYLLHGAGDDETGWTQKGSADVILDNLHADKKIVPMIVVMPNGFARRPGAAKPDAAKPDAAKPDAAKPDAAKPGAGKRGGMGRDNSAFADDLLKDIIPYVESHYAVRADRQSRAIAGLSMGGGQSLSIGLGHRELFAWVGGFSSAPSARLPDDLTAQPGDSPKGLRLLWLSCGDTDRLMERSKSFHASLEEKKVPHVWHIDSGGHAWPVWKNDLYLISQLLFLEKRQAP
jgi:enterochelin esterase-like enzyme